MHQVAEKEATDVRKKIWCLFIRVEIFLRLRLGGSKFIFTLASGQLTKKLAVGLLNF